MLDVTNITDPAFASLLRRSYRSDVKRVIYIQSCIRRRLARKELKALKAEARSVSKFKEISYRLENKVVELTQSLQKRTEEKKGLEAQLRQIEQQLQTMVSRHEEADTRAKQLQISLAEAQAEITARDELLAKKADVEKRLEEALAKATEKEEMIQKLTDDILRQATQLEAQQKTIDATPVRNPDDSSVILTLKNEVSSLREQLNRANALNALTSRGRVDQPPLSPTFAPNLRLADPANAAANGVAAPNGRSHQRRHSSAGVYAISPSDNRTSVDELMMMAKKQTSNPRAVSVAYNGEEGAPRFRGSNGLADIYDDPAEEKIRLMQDIKHLDEDVLDGLIRGLKIPAPNASNPPVVKEILFPANLISLVTNEMWKYGLIQESERFLANVMQTIQSHVMVRIFFTIQCVCPNPDVARSLSLEKTRSSPASSGCPTSTRCSPLSASPRATCFRALAPARRMRFDRSSGVITSGWSRSSSTISTVWNTTSTTLGCWRRRRGFRRWSSPRSSRANRYRASRRPKAEDASSTVS